MTIDTIPRDMDATLPTHMDIAVGDIQATVDRQTHQLTSLSKGGVEYLHGGGRSGGTDLVGWQHSEIVMFPIVGPDPGGALGQHGTARHIPFSLMHAKQDHLVLEQQHGGEHIANAPGREPAVMRFQEYCLRKAFHALPDGIEATITVQNPGPSPLRYQLGWHPAFAAPDPERDTIAVNGERTSVAQLQGMPGAVKAYAGSTDAALERGDGTRIELRAPDFRHLVAWSPPGSRMVCIEPVTHLPDGGTQRELLKAGDQRAYRIRLRTG